MSRLGVLVVRRFAARVQRQDHVTEARRAVELPFAPSPGMILAFGDGSGECVVSKIRLRVQPAGRLGLLPLEVEAIGCQEPAAGLEAALAAGWQAEADAPVVGLAPHARASTSLICPPPGRCNATTGPDRLAAALRTLWR